VAPHWRQSSHEGVYVNISSVIVHPRPGEAEDVRARLVAIAGIEIHAVATDGRMIAIVETSSDGAMVDAFDAINNTEGVMSAAMVFHQSEADPEMEISVAAGPRARPQPTGDQTCN
jgi:periplasmic nitrate reductase NapD